MEILLTIDKFLQMAPVRWLLLVATAFLMIVTVASLVRQKALSIELALSEAAVSEYVVAASVAEMKRKELEGKVAAASAEILVIKSNYEARIDKINKTKITPATCAEMVAQSVKILQDSE